MSLFDRVLTEAKLSLAQRRYLLALVRVFARANRAELARWGNPIGWVNEMDVAGELGKSERQTLALGNKAIGAKLAELRTHVSHGSKLRLGAFGRWIGGAERTTSVSRLVRPTKAGVALAKKLAEA